MERATQKELQTTAEFDQLSANDAPGVLDVQYQLEKGCSWGLSLFDCLNITVAFVGIMGLNRTTSFRH